MTTTHLSERNPIYDTRRALLERYANACATALQCIGHGKRDRNFRQAEYWARELRKLGVIPPDFFAAADKGKFNGEGSS